MGLKEYYKIHIYDYGYNKGYDDSKKFIEAVKNGEKFEHHLVCNDIHFNDEIDYMLIADWLGSFEPEEDDIKFIEALGFSLEDFEEE